jgi:hypothetical protein
MSDQWSVFLQINTIKYDTDWVITNIYKNLQIVRTHFCTNMLLFSLLQISIGLSVFGFVANEYKQITIRSVLTIRNIWSGIRWAKPKVILNYSCLPTRCPYAECYTAECCYAKYNK